MLRRVVAAQQAQAAKRFRATKPATPSGTALPPRTSFSSAQCCNAMFDNHAAATAAQENASRAGARVLRR
jgi:hypothetical protein